MACQDRPSNKYIGTNGFFTYLFINLCFGLGCGIISLIEDMLTKDFCVSVVVLVESMMACRKFGLHQNLLIHAYDSIYRLCGNLKQLVA